MIVARAPAKIILSGEHAVLYNNSALAVALNLYTTTTVSWQKDLAINFELKDLAYIKSLSFDALKKLLTLKSIKKPFNLVQCLVARLLQNLALPLKRGLNIKVNSEIPVGYGLGSSAACIISNLYALEQTLKLNFTDIQRLDFAQQIESLQHGKSSGLDLKISKYGGCIRIKDNQLLNRKLPDFPLCLVNTGRPISSTKQCVLQSKKILQNNNALLNDFALATDLIDISLSSNNFDGFKEGIKYNHRLLQKISVVPHKVSSFIDVIENCGGAAKVCGAGAVLGDNAGFVLVAGDKENVGQIAANYGYKFQEVQIDEFGTRII